MFNISEQLKKLPDKPGVYLMKNEYGDIIYVGKAISLKNRVRQYFQSSKNQLPKVRAMVSNISEFEYIITDSEIEALILESNLIKKNQPKYNVLLRDDKSFPYIKITYNEKYPRILKTRRVLKDGAKYFGPYTDAGAVNQILDLLNKIYPLKKCGKTAFSKNHNVCLNYHIGQCLGICIYHIDKESYDKMIDEITAFLQGKSNKILDYLNKEMFKAAEELNYERAAEYRDYIHAVQALTEKQKIILASESDMDVLAVSRGEKECHALIFFIRLGKLTGRESYTVQASTEDSIEGIADAFIKQFYTGSTYIPKEIITSDLPEEKTIIEEWLSQMKGSKVKIHTPIKGEKRAILDMAVKNVVEITELLDEKARNERLKIENALMALKTYLNTPKVPVRIEAYDISNTSGVDSVGSMVVFEEGKPKKSDYRRFKIKTIEGPNDYGSLQEVIFRRFKNSMENTDADDNKNSFLRMPDLLLIDGGEKQVDAVQDILTALKINIPVAGMVKDDKHRTRGLVYQGSELNIKENHDAYVFVSEIQEEAHRFAISYHKSLREKALTKSVLDEIEGIGPARKSALLRHFGSIDKIKRASIEELCEVENMNKAAAEKIVRFFIDNHEEHEENHNP